MGQGPEQKEHRAVVGNAHQAAIQDFPPSQLLPAVNHHPQAHHQGHQEGNQQKPAVQIPASRLFKDFGQAVGQSVAQQQDQQTAPAGSFPGLPGPHHPDGAAGQQKSQHLHPGGNLPEGRHRKHHGHNQSQPGKGCRQDHPVFPDVGLQNHQRQQIHHALGRSQSQSCAVTVLRECLYRHGQEGQQGSGSVIHGEPGVHPPAPGFPDAQHGRHRRAGANGQQQIQHKDFLLLLFSGFSIPIPAEQVNPHKQKAGAP